jgi:N-acetylmuramoyl-L-alanine amidase CwlA
MVPKGITVHCDGNYASGATAEANANYLADNSQGRVASWHYSVDEFSIWQSFEDWQQCYHAGDGNGKGNTETIAIEICVNSQSGFPKAVANAAWLVSELRKRHSFHAQAVYQHNHWSGKDCPKELRSGVWGPTWNSFLDQVECNMAPPINVQEEEAMTELEKQTVLKRLDNLEAALKVEDSELTEQEKLLQPEWAYNDTNLPGYARPYIQALQDEKILIGDQEGKFSISKYLLTLYVLVGKVVVWVKNRSK